MSYTHNSDLSHYDKCYRSTNCGSYALRLNEWYHLNELFENVTGSFTDDWVTDMGNEGLTDYEISCIYEDILVDCLLNDFEGELKLCTGNKPKDPNIELIAFNTFCYYDAGGYSDYDFHFKVFRDGVWKEKCGALKVRECEEDDWGEYIGETIYFYHRIK